MSLFRHCTGCHVLIYGTLERCGNCIRRDTERERAGKHWDVAEALVHLKAVVMAGGMTDWMLSRPTHDVLMLSVPTDPRASWRAELTAILSAKGVLLYDDPFGDGDGA